jgi:opacity protein-like surface antigen
MPYVGAGLGYFQFKETNSIKTVEKGAIGFVVRAGLVFKLGAPFFMDVQGTWSTCSVQPLEVQANLGGFSAGVGLGLEF